MGSALMMERIMNKFTSIRFGAMDLSNWIGKGCNKCIEMEILPKQFPKVYIKRLA